MGDSLESGANLFQIEALKIINEYSKLQLIEKDNQPILCGQLELIDSKGIFCNSYSIEIHPTKEYPWRFPHLFEVGGRIPRNIDWHIFETDGRCCVKSIPEEILRCKKGISLKAFIEDEVKPYFFNQTFREKRGYFLNERSHGFLGELEFFQEVFDTKDLLQIVKFLIFISKRNEPNRVAKCFCGNNEKYRKCHKDAYHKLTSFDDKDFKCFINRIISSNEFVSAHPLIARQLWI